jgi:hypothetical protein
MEIEMECCACNKSQLLELTKFMQTVNGKNVNIAVFTCVRCETQIVFHDGEFHHAGAPHINFGHGPGMWYSIPEEHLANLKEMQDIAEVA